MKRLLLSISFLGGMLAATAQPVCNGNMVTFQYKNDSARQVMVDVQFAGRKEMTRNADGLWTVTFSMAVSASIA